MDVIRRIVFNVELMIVSHPVPSLYLFTLLLLARHGNKAFAENNFADAIQFYSQAIQEDPSNHVYFSNRR